MKQEIKREISIDILLIVSGVFAIFAIGIVALPHMPS
jgi:hypothetical protein